MTLENLPKQEYELTNMRMQTIDSGNTITYIVTIKGKTDNKSYCIPLNCLKELLNKTTYLNENAIFHFEEAQIELDKVKRTLDRMNKNAEAYDFKLFIIEEKGYFFFEYIFKENVGEFKKGESGGRTCFLNLNALPIFQKYIKNI